MRKKAVIAAELFCAVLALYAPLMAEPLEARFQYVGTIGQALERTLKSALTIEEPILAPVNVGEKIEDTIPQTSTPIEQPAAMLIAPVYHPTRVAR
jgi:hypothetical protein